MPAPSVRMDRPALHLPMVRARLTAAAGLVVVAVGLVGCGAAMPAAPSPVPSIGAHVSVLATWSGRELDAFRAVVAPFEAATGIVVDYERTSDLRTELDRRIAAGDLPDISGLVGPDHMADLARAGVLRDLGSALDVATYRQQTAPAFVSLGMVDDRLVGAFVKATLKGLVWFDPRRNRLGVPSSWDDLQRTALRFSTDALRPWCVGLASGSASGWPGTDWVEAILLGQSGRRAYDQWVAGRLSWRSPEVRQAFEGYLQVVADGMVAGGPAATVTRDFKVAASGPFATPPDCLYTQGASFTPALFAHPGLEPERDYDFFPLPAIDPQNDGSMEVAGDLFGLLSGRPEATALMSWLVSPDAQRIWVEDGAALSGNIEVTAYPDPVIRREAELLTGATDVRFDASDQMDVGVAQAFQATVLDVTADPSTLDDALARIDAVSAGPAGGAP